MGYNTSWLLGFIIIVWAVIGSRLAYVLMNFSHYRAYPLDFLKVWQGGLVFSGGLIAVIAALGWYIKRHHLSFWNIGDLWAPGAAIGQGLGRIGCFMAGCCYGKPTAAKWGVIFTHPKSLAPLNIPIHPTQLYSALSGIIIFIILMTLRKRKQFQGQIFLWFLIFHSTARLLIERYRGDDRGVLLGSDMSVTQLLTLLLLLSAVATLIVLKSRIEKKGTIPDQKISN